MYLFWFFIDAKVNIIPLLTYHSIYFLGMFKDKPAIL